MSGKGIVLIVDDDKLNLTTIGDALLSFGYEVLKASNGKDALNIAIGSKPDVILLDIVMPGMDGYTVCRSLRESDITKYIPVVMLTVLNDTESRYKGLEAGAIDFLNKPPDMVELNIRLKNVIQLKEYHDFLKNYNELLKNTVDQKTRELRESYIDTIYRLTLAAEYKEKGIASHLKRVSHYATLLAKHLGLPAKEAETMLYASPMHDIGKIGIPDEILLKPSELLPEEFEVMKKHTIIGEKILSGSGSEYMKSGTKFAIHHHEHWDGTGYPYGLRGEEISIAGRIMLIIDRYDALCSSRPYKAEIDHETSVKILIHGHKKTIPAHYDPRVLEAFKDNLKEFKRIYEEYRDA